MGRIGWTIQRVARDSWKLQNLTKLRKATRKFKETIAELASQISPRAGSDPPAAPMSYSARRFVSLSAGLPARRSHCLICSKLCIAKSSARSHSARR